MSGIGSERSVIKLEKKIAKLEREIDKHKQAEAALAKDNRLLRTLAACNRAMMRAERESDLAESVCRIIVENDNYELAWIGLVQDSNGGTLTSVGRAFSQRLSEGADSLIQALLEQSLPQALAALASGRPVFSRQTGLPVDTGISGKHALHQDTGSFVSLPLVAGGSKVGAVTIYSTKPDVFATKQIEWLNEIATDLAFAIGSLRTRGETTLGPQASRAREQLLELVINVSKGGIWDLVLKPGDRPDSLSDEMFISPAMKGFIGFEDHEFPNSISAWQQRIFPDDMELIRDSVRANFQGKKNLHEVEYRIRHKDGGVRRIRSCGSIQRDGLGRLVRWSGIDWDVTEQRQADEEHRRLTTVLEQAATAVIITDRHGQIEYVNPEFGRVSGFSREEVIGRNLDIFKNDRQSEEFYQEMQDTLTAGKIWAGRYTIRTKAGPYRVFEATISPVLDRVGKVINFVCVNRDVTQEVALEIQLRQAQKIEAIGTLAAGIAHDFNNILGGIIGYTELVMCQLQPGEQSMADLEQVVKACYRARELVKQILVFSRKGDQGKNPVNVTLVVKEALKMLRASLPTTIRIVPRLLSDTTTVLADPTQIHQVLVNLFTNAAHAVNETDGIVEVSVTDVFIEAEDSVFFPELAEGNYLKIEVTDNGHGIEPEDLERIFDPYFSTKKKDEGTGLGLAVVRGIVESHKGAIRVQSEPGKGATFAIFLPAIEEESKPEFDAPMALPFGTERVLLVDDEPTLVNLCKNMLVRLGYQVETANGGVEALEKFLAGPDRFDLVITDYTMPYLTGEGLAQQIMEIRPDLPIVMCTGFSKRIDEGRAKTLGIRQFIMKPVAMRELARAVRAALESK